MERNQILSMTSQQRVEKCGPSSREDLINNADNIIKCTVARYFPSERSKRFPVLSHLNPPQSDLMVTVAGTEVGKLRQGGGY